MSQPSLGSLHLDTSPARIRAGEQGIQYVARDLPLAAHAARMSDRLRYWASTTPDALFLAERARSDSGDGDWVRLTYGDAWERAQCIAQFLLGQGLSEQRPVAILSGNSLRHALLSLACLVVGIPVAPISPAYSLVDRSFSKLRHVMASITPGLIFVEDAAPFAAAIEAAVDVSIPVVTGAGAGGLSDRVVLPFASLLAQQPTAAVAEACARTGPDTIAKFLFTSGSTKLPRAVINTNRMWTANMVQIAQCWPFVAEEELVLVDWLPWHHTFGGNQNFGLVLYFGGTLYIDGGRPTPHGMALTLRNIADIAPTVYLSVPTGFEQLAIALQDDPALRRRMFSRLKTFFYAGASLSQSTWDSLAECSRQELGSAIPMLTGFGMTEAAPMAIFVTRLDLKAGEIGLPMPGMEIKLVPQGEKTEVRYRGPNITPGYWRAPGDMASHFDEEGFLCTGDAVQWVDTAQRSLGLRFDGRTAEDFKLTSGTFVSVGALRAKVIAAGAPYVQDVVITGADRAELGAMVFPTTQVGQLAGAPAGAPLEQILQAPAVVAFFRQLLGNLIGGATGSSNRISRLCVLAEPPSLALDECTDKGSVNQRAVLLHRNALVHALYDGSAPHMVLAQDDRQY
ncbi:MAG: feruloyl-CoA synthase [Sphingomonadaceae bacterium]